MKTFLFLTILAFVVPLCDARWRWEDIPIVGLLCLPVFEPHFCIRDRTRYFVEEFCGNNPEAPDEQLWFLGDLYYGSGNTDESGYLFDKGWLDNCDYCTWDGIACNEDGAITEIDISDGRLSGTLPSELGNLSALESLVVYGNEFNGNIPSELGLLSSLTNLRLHYNNLRGRMPEEVCLLGGVNGINITISADCGKPRAEVYCNINTCCDLCYIDSLRPSN